MGGVAQEALFRQKFDRFDKDKDNTVARKDLKDLIAALDIPVGFKKRVALADKMDPEKTGEGCTGQPECVCAPHDAIRSLPIHAWCYDLLVPLRFAGKIPYAPLLAWYTEEVKDINAMPDNLEDDKDDEGEEEGE